MNRNLLLQNASNHSAQRTWSNALGTLAEAAMLAPSGDNTQPWALHIDVSNTRVEITLDPTRDQSPMNTGQRMSWISLGAALENMVFVAVHNRWAYDIQESRRSTSIAIQLHSTYAPGDIPNELYERCTNRSVYHPSARLSQRLERVQNRVSDIDGVVCHWKHEKKALSRLGNLIARADGLMFGNPKIRQAFLANVRFDRPADEVVSEGLSVGSLAVSGSEKQALKLLPHLPNWLFRLTRSHSVFSNKALQLTDSASAFLLVESLQQDLRSRLSVGRMWQRAWLALTNEAFSVQPMMSLCVISAISRYDNGGIFRPSEQKELDRLLSESQNFFSEQQMSLPDAIMRIGDCPLPPKRTGRCPSRIDGFE